jgi:hypothetical protein
MVNNTERQILWAMAEGHFLKSHRDLDGSKTFKLHTSSGQVEIIPPSVVHSLRKKGWIDSNKKFPVATFWLTEAGRSRAGQLNDPSRFETI